MTADIEYAGAKVIIKPDDPVYARKRAKVVKVAEREGSAYLGLEVEQRGLDHIVWPATPTKLSSF